MSAAPRRQGYLNHFQARSRISTYNNVSYVLIDYLRGLAPINPPSGFVLNVSLFRCLSNASDHPPSEVRDTYLIVHADDISRTLDEPVQSCCVVHVL